MIKRSEKPWNNEHKELIEVFFRYGKLRKYEKNSVIYHEGFHPSTVYYIEKGILKIGQSTLEGRDVTFFFRKSGDIFGYAEVITNQDRERLAQCLSDCTIWELGSNTFLKEVENNLSVLGELLKITNLRLLQQQRNFEMLISQPVSWRLAWILKELSTVNDDGNCIIEKPLTHTELSNIIGCSRQTITENLRRWNEKKLIEYNRKYIKILSIEKLFT